MNRIGNHKPLETLFVTVEYDGNGRETKMFKGTKSVFQARSFYTKKFKEGKNPKILSAKGK